jgi:hypothetical protein
MRWIAVVLLAAVCGCAAAPSDSYFAGDWRGGGETMHRILSFIDSHRHELKRIKVGYYDLEHGSCDPATEIDVGSDCLEVVMDPEKAAIEYNIRGVLDALLRDNQYQYFYCEDGEEAFRYETGGMCTDSFWCKMEFEDFSVYLGTANEVSREFVLQLSGDSCINAPTCMCQFRNPRLCVAIMRLLGTAMEITINEYFDKFLDRDPSDDACDWMHPVLSLLSVLGDIYNHLPRDGEVTPSPVDRGKMVNGWESVSATGLGIVEKVQCEKPSQKHGR